MEKKKMKLLKAECIRSKKEIEDLTAKLEKYEADSKTHLKEITTRDEEIVELKEKNNKLEDNMLQLQNKMMEEMGILMNDDKPKNDDSSGNDGTTASSNSGNTKNSDVNDFEFNQKP